MKQDITLEQLYEFLQGCGMALSIKQKQQVARYFELLRSWGGRQNLVSQNDLNFIVGRHLLVGFYYVYRLFEDGFATQKTADLGSGAGIPGVLLSVFFADSSIVLLDSSRKKALFLRRVVEELGLKSRVVVGRAEEMGFEERERFSVVVARAVAPLPRLLYLSSFLIEKEGVLYSFKGQNYRQEIKGDKLPARVAIKELPVEKEWNGFSEYFNGKLMLRLEFKDVGE